MKEYNPKQREAFKPEALGKEFENTFRNIRLPEKASSDEILALVKKAFQAHNPDKFAEAMRKSLGKFANEKKIDKAKRHYKKFFDTASARFYRLAENRRQGFEEARFTILSAARKSRENLMADIGHAIKAKETEPKPDNLESQRQTEKSFENYVAAMGQEYFESKQHNQMLRPAGQKEYKELTGRFQYGMRTYVDVQLQHIFENTHDRTALKKKITELKESVKNAYTANDKNQDGALDLYELRELHKSTSEFLDLAKLISSAKSSEELYKQLEKLNYFNRQNLKNATKIITEQFIADATRNGTEAQFIKAVQKLTKSKKKMDFDDAANIYRSHMAKLSNTEVKEVIKAARQMNEGVNKGRIELLKLEHVNPPSIRVLVRRQRDLILQREIEPKQIDDRLVAEFMSANLVGRMKLLNDKVRRNALFQAIQNIKRHYPKIYKDKFKDGIPKKISDLTTRSTRPDLPTTHDRIARMLAILTLAKEAEWTVKNLSQSEGLKSLNLAKALENTKADKIPPRINNRYRWRGTLYRTGYVSRAVRGGFNARDMAIGALKLWAGATLFLNFMNARKHSSGSWIEGLKNVIPNPYFLGGAATIYGLHKYQQNPEYKRYLSQDEGGQETISTHAALTSLTGKKFTKTEKVGRGRVAKFLSGPGEFDAMRAIMKNRNSGSKVRNLLEKIREKARKEKNNYPSLTRDDLKKLGIADDKLPQPGNNRVRFLFYEKFMTQTRRANDLIENCKSWK